MKHQFKAWALKNSKGHFETYTVAGNNPLEEQIIFLYGEAQLSQAQKRADELEEYTGSTIKPVPVLVTVEDTST